MTTKKGNPSGAIAWVSVTYPRPARPMIGRAITLLQPGKIAIYHGETAETAEHLAAHLTKVWTDRHTK